MDRQEMRVPTELRVKALLRRCDIAGVPAVVARHGDADAGILFVKLRLLDGTARLLGPAPAGTGADDPLPRLVAHLPAAGGSDAAAKGVGEADVDAYLARQAQFDSDLWVIEIDDRLGRDFLDD